MQFYSCCLTKWKLGCAMKTKPSFGIWSRQRSQRSIYIYMFDCDAAHVLLSSLGSFPGFWPWLLYNSLYHAKVSLNIRFWGIISQVWRWLSQLFWWQEFLVIWDLQPSDIYLRNMGTRYSAKKKKLSALEQGQNFPPMLVIQLFFIPVFCHRSS